MTEKNNFLALVSAEIHSHPDWLADTQLSIQQALEARVHSEEEKVASLAYAMSIYVNYSPKVTKNYWAYGLARGIEVLAAFFEGTGFGKQVKDLLEAHKNSPDKEE